MKFCVFHSDVLGRSYGYVCADEHSDWFWYVDRKNHRSGKVEQKNKYSQKVKTEFAKSLFVPLPHVRQLISCVLAICLLLRVQCGPCNTLGDPFGLNPVPPGVLHASSKEYEVAKCYTRTEGVQQWLIA